MNAEIITIGDELLIGQVANSNASFIAERLNTIGVDVTRMVTVGDALQPILDAFGEARQRAPIVIATGGLGPTHDDITKKAACTFFETDLVSDPGVRRHIETLMARRNIAWTPAAEEQALVPRKATVVPNPIGTAAGLHFTEAAKHFFILPGVPYEMEAMMDQSVIPFLRSIATGDVIVHRTLRTTGIAESLLAQRIGRVEEFLAGAQLAFLPSPLGVRLRITVKGSDEQTAREHCARVEAILRRRARKYIYGVENEELEEVLGRLLVERGLTIAVAESCTGGLIADRITNVSGSSRYFERGVVAYSNRSKTDLLGVPEALIEAHGAVSREVAEAMAAGVRRAAGGADIGLSTTGIAGPTGGTTDKPVGLVWIAYSDASNTLAVKFNFGEGRSRVKLRASQAALELVRRRLLNIQ